MYKFLTSIPTLSLLLLFSCCRLVLDTFATEVSDVPICLLGNAADGIGQNGTGTYKLGLERIGQDGIRTYRLELERIGQLGFELADNTQEEINI